MNYKLQPGPPFFYTKDPKHKTEKAIQSFPVVLAWEELRRALAPQWWAPSAQVRRPPSEVAVGGARVAAHGLAGIALDLGSPADQGHGRSNRSGNTGLWWWWSLTRSE
jgi:hypothetical protein